MKPSDGRKSITMGGMTFPFTISTDGNGVTTATDGRHSYSWTGTQFVATSIESTVRFLDEADEDGFTVYAYVGPKPPTFPQQVIRGAWA